MSEGRAAIPCVGVPAVTSRFCAFYAYLLWMQLAWLWSFPGLAGNNVCQSGGSTSDARDTPHARALMESSLEIGSHHRHRFVPERTDDNGSGSPSLIFSQPRAQHQSLTAHLLT